MAITTTISGKMQRFNGDNLEMQRRISGSRTITEYGGHKITIGPASCNISIRPAGLACIRTLYVETDYKINIEITGVRTSSFNIHDNGILMMMNASLSNVRLSNRSATNTAHPFYDLSG